jgi:integrase
MMPTEQLDEVDAVADLLDTDVDLLDAFTAAQHLLGGSAAYQRVRQRAAGRFLEQHPDLEMWMTRPIGQRLADVSSSSEMWPMVTFALISTRVRADAEFLLTKGFGHSMRRWVTGLYPNETRKMHDAAARINISEFQANAFIAEGLAFAIAFCGKPPAQLTETDIDACVTAVRNSTAGTPAIRHSRGSKLFGVRKLLFEAGLVDCPPARRRQGGPLTRQGRLAAVAAPEIRATILNYLDARSAVLRPKTIDKLTSALAVFGEFVTDAFPELVSIEQLERRHIEAFLTWTSTRSCRNYHGDRPVGPFVTAHAAISVRAFLDDITEWGWPAPARRLMFTSDIPKQPALLPRALAPDVDHALMAAVDNLDDPFARVGLTILRGTGLRIGELLELELDAIVDYGPAGSWLRVPLGKLNTERVVPLDAATLDAFDDWFTRRQQQRALPHPRHGRPVDFVFVENGRHLGPTRIQRGLRDAVRAAGITGADGQPLRIVAHQLRHTYATSLVNAGMTLQALMQLLGHSSPEMTMRYARLSSPTLRAAYDQAVGKLRRRIPVAPVIGGRAVPNDVDWIRSEMLKTRVAHGHCSRDLAAEACAYANICETCSNFTPTIEFEPAITAQLDDIRTLRDDANDRGWTSETARHERVIASLEHHLQRLQRTTPQPETP